MLTVSLDSLAIDFATFLAWPTTSFQPIYYLTHNNIDFVWGKKLTHSHETRPSQFQNQDFK